MKVNTNFRIIGFCILVLSIYMPLYAQKNAYLDKNSDKYNNLKFMLEDYNGARPLHSDPPSKIENTRHYYSLGLSFYKKNDYEKAIDNYLLAMKYYVFPIIYYQLGLCLMDSGDLENAKRSFNLSNKYVYYDGVEDLYTKDANGLKREEYYSSYNIACIESLRNNISESYKYLCEALFRGYPYIDYIKKDADLKNLFTAENGFYLKEIEKIYNAGMKNTFTRKGYSFYLGGTREEYYFIDNKNILIRYNNEFIGLLWLTAEYEIKNYRIIYKNLRYQNNPPEWWRKDPFSHPKDFSYVTKYWMSYIKEFEKLRIFWDYPPYATVEEVPLMKYNDMRDELREYF
jgi:tetratricopeptide (TPR) repeat protein